MADEPPVPHVPWYKDVKQVLLIITAITGLSNVVIGGINSIISNWNHEQSKDNGNDLKVVSMKQDAVVADAADVKKDLAETKAVTAARLDAVKAATEVVAEKTSSIDRKIK